MTIHEQVIQGMREMADRYSATGVALELPPRSNQTLGTLYREIDLGKRLVAEILYHDRFANPMQAFQGGFLCAAFDEVYGPLSYMAAQRPAVTLEMGATFVRPFRPDDRSALFQAEVVAVTHTLIVMRGEARTKSGKLIATSTNTSLILSDDQLRGFGTRRKKENPTGIPAVADESLDT